ncbi:MAG: polyprenol monophosphomannose synthase [Candidatus Micrarchaeota archaeon]
MLSIIIPTYNERENIPLLISRLEASLCAEHEIIIVDDSSPDGTAVAVSEIAKNDKTVYLISRKAKTGLTGAVVEGVKAAKGDIIIVMDADLSHPPEAVPKLAEALKGADIAIGSRLAQGGGVESWPMHRKVISSGADTLARLLLGISCSDPMSGFFAMRRSAFLKIRFRSRGYKLLLNILADNPKAKVAEVPYTFKDRHAGKTKLGAGETINYVFDLLRIKLG